MGKKLVDKRRELTVTNKNKNENLTVSFTMN